MLYNITVKTAFTVKTVNTVNTVETGDESERPKYIKLTIPRKLHTSFKKACTESGVGMHAQILQLMEDYSNTVNTVNTVNAVNTVNTVNTVKPVDDNEIIDDTVNDPNKVFAVLLEKLEKINQRLDAVENKDGVDSPTEKTTEIEQNNDEESDRLDAEAVGNSIIDAGRKEDIATNNTDSNILTDAQNSTIVKTKHTTKSTKASNNGHLDSETKKERKKRVPMPEKIVVGTKLLPNQLTKRLSEYQISLGKKSVGSGTLQNNRKNKANLSNPNYHQDWIRARDPDGILWKYIEEENIYAAIEVPKTKEIC